MDNKYNIKIFLVIICKYFNDKVGGHQVAEQPETHSKRDSLRIQERELFDPDNH